MVCVPLPCLISRGYHGFLETNVILLCYILIFMFLTEINNCRQCCRIQQPVKFAEPNMAPTNKRGNITMQQL